MTHSFTQKTAFALYQLVWSVALPILHRNHRLRQGWEQRLLKKKPKPCELWIQAASVGESYLAGEIIRRLNPEKRLRILLTTNTSQGMEVLEKNRRSAERTKLNMVVQTGYCPFDQPKIMARAMARVRPRLVVLLESELWPGLMATCRQKKIKMAVINGRINEKSLKRYRVWPSLWHNLRPDKVLAISENDSARFATLFGADIVETMHNIKFDRVNELGLAAGRVNPLSALIGPDEHLLVLGSVREEEEKDIAWLIKNIMRKSPGTIIGLFPRHMHRLKSWRKALARLSLPWLLRSDIQDQVKSGTVVLWDVMGELSPAYAIAQTAFVGGSLVPVGGQNFLEPLTCGIRPVIGPNWTNFLWIGREIINQGLVTEVKDRRELAEVLLKRLNQPLQRQEIKKAVISYVRSRQGGTQQACRTIQELLGSNSKK